MSNDPIANYLWTVDPTNPNDIVFTDPNYVVQSNLPTFISLPDVDLGGDHTYNGHNSQILACVENGEFGTGLVWIPNTTSPPTAFAGGLTDTPNSYSGFNNFAVAVNAGATALTFVPFPTGQTGSFITLSDVSPHSYSGVSGNVVVVNGGATGVTFIPPRNLSLLTSQLADGPGGPTAGNANEFVTVNGSGSALIYTTVSATSTSFTTLTDTFNSYVGKGGDYLTVRQSEDGITWTTLPPGSSGGVTQFSQLTDAYVLTGHNGTLVQNYNSTSLAPTKFCIYNPVNQINISAMNGAMPMYYYTDGAQHIPQLIIRPKLNFQVNYAAYITQGNNAGYEKSQAIACDNLNDDAYHLFGASTTNCSGDPLRYVYQQYPLFQTPAVYPFLFDIYNGIIHLNDINDGVGPSMYPNSYYKITFNACVQYKDNPDASSLVTFNANASIGTFPVSTKNFSSSVLKSRPNSCNVNFSFIQQIAPTSDIRFYYRITGLTGQTPSIEVYNYSILVEEL